MTTKFYEITRNEDGVFNTKNGTLINLMKPEENHYCIKDIANALSNICRFGGHVNEFYSVAQHSILVSYMVPKSLALEGLLHDATEAYLGDMIKPLKNRIPTYIAFEAKFGMYIDKAFHLKKGYQLNEHIKMADTLALKMEHEALQVGNPALMIQFMKQHNLIIKDKHIYTPEIAKLLFLARFNDLTESI